MGVLVSSVLIKLRSARRLQDRVVLGAILIDAWEDIYCHCQNCFAGSQVNSSVQCPVAPVSVGCLREKTPKLQTWGIKHYYFRAV